MSQGFYRRGKPNRARRLKNLQIDEVSTVDSGAGHGVRVVLAKRNERKAPMPTIEQVRDANVSLLRKSNAEPTLAPDHYEQLMKRSAISNALEVFRIKQEFSKGRAIDANSGSNPAAQAAAADEARDWSKIDWNDDKQASAAHRREKRMKEEMLGTHLNPKSISP